MDNWYFERVYLTYGNVHEVSKIFIDSRIDHSITFLDDHNPFLDIESFLKDEKEYLRIYRLLAVIPNVSAHIYKTYSDATNRFEEIWRDHIHLCVTKVKNVPAEDLTSLLEPGFFRQVTPSRNGKGFDILFDFCPFSFDEFKDSIENIPEHLHNKLEIRASHEDDQYKAFLMEARGFENDFPLWARDALDYVRDGGWK